MRNNFFTTETCFGENHLGGKTNWASGFLLSSVSLALMCMVGCGQASQAHSAKKPISQRLDGFEDASSEYELPSPPVPRGHLKLIPIGGFDHGGETAAEISAYDPQSRRLFTVNGKKRGVDILDLSKPSSPQFVCTVEFKILGKPTSVAVSNGRIAASVAADDRSKRGHVVFLNPEGTVLNTLEVGYEPDMLTFTADGRLLLICNEGEPVDDYSFDAPGSIGVIDVSEAIEALTAANVSEITFKKFDSQRNSLDSRVRIFGPNASVSQDLEPEYITVSDDGQIAWVVCQEANAIAIIDLAAREVQKLVGLGFKDHSLDGNWLDASDKDGGIQIRPWPVKGMYQPDGIAHFHVDGKTWLVTANEGDQRDHQGFSEKATVKDLKLDPQAFPDANQLQKNENLGRLQVTSALGDTDGDGLFEELYCHGGRSFSIWSSDGELVFDSGDQFERFIAENFPENFNSDNEEASFDDRSDNKGVEPEGVTVGEIDGRIYAFIGLERQGGLFAYDVTDPRAPILEAYVNLRDFSGDTGDSGPEGILFLSRQDSPTGHPMLVVSNEISGTTRFLELTSVQGGAPSKSP